MDTMHRSRERGFSLIEMLVVIFIVAVVSRVATPSLLELLQQYQLSGAASQVAFEISRAKMQAAAQNRVVRVARNSAQSAICRQTALTTSGPWTPASCDDTTDVIELPGDAVVSGDLPTFRRTGIADASASLQVALGDLSKSIDVNILGRVTVQ